MKYSKFLILLIIPLIITCNPKTNEETDDEEYNDTLINYNFNSVEFNSDSAYSYVQKQVDFGPRVPNTKAHVNCGDWLGNMLKKWCDTVYIQNFQVKNYKNVFLNGKNIIGSINPNAKRGYCYVPIGIHAHKPIKIHLILNFRQTEQMMVEAV